MCSFIHHHLLLISFPPEGGFNATFSMRTSSWGPRVPDIGVHDHPDWFLESPVEEGQPDLQSLFATLTITSLSLSIGI